MRKGLVTLLAFMVFCLFTAPAAAVTLQDVDGTWKLNIAETKKRTGDSDIRQELQEDPEEYINFVLIIDVDKHTLTISMPGSSPDSIGFRPGQSDGKSLRVTLDDGSSLHMEFVSEGLLMVGSVDEGSTAVETDLYFDRAK